MSVLIVYDPPFSKKVKNVIFRTWFGTHGSHFRILDVLRPKNHSVFSSFDLSGFCSGEFTSIVTGPLFSNSTFIIAPKTPVWILSLLYPKHSQKWKMYSEIHGALPELNSLRKRSKSFFASSPPIALWKSGLLPFNTENLFIYNQNKDGCLFSMVVVSIPRNPSQMIIGATYHILDSKVHFFYLNIK